MKPTKNKHFCIAARRSKMLFESESKADNFIRFNAKEFIEEGNKVPIRSYYCNFCMGWHVTSNPSIEEGERLDKRDEALQRKILHVVERKSVSSFGTLYQQRITQIEGLINQFQFDKAEAELEIIDIHLEDYIAATTNLNKIARAKSQVSEHHKLLDKTRALYNLTDKQIEKLEADPLTDKYTKKIILRIQAVRYLEDVLPTIPSIKDVVLRNEVIRNCKTKISNIKGTGIKPLKSEYTKRLEEVKKQVSKKGIYAHSSIIHKSDWYKSNLRSLLSIIDNSQELINERNLGEAIKNIEIGYALLENLNIDDENTRLIKSVLNRLHDDIENKH